MKLTFLSLQWSKGFITYFILFLKHLDIHEFSEIFLCPFVILICLILQSHLLIFWETAHLVWRVDLNLFSGLKIFLQMSFFFSTSLLIVLNIADLVYLHGQHETQSRYSFWPFLLLVRTLVESNANSSFSLPSCLSFFWLSSLCDLTNVW